jgi:RNA polymerase sigma factor (TIGR02999 family)
MSKPPASTRVTRILQAPDGGSSDAAEELLPLVYDELRRLAHGCMRAERSGQTLQATELVHEAYLRLVGSRDIAWESRGHFFATAARAMRRILVDRARRRGTARRGGGLRRVTLDRIEVADRGPDDPEVVLALNEALEKLERLDPRKARVVMLRYFVGLTIEETALALELSPGTVQNDWRFSRAWLYSEMTRERAAPD